MARGKAKQQAAAAADAEQEAAVPKGAVLDVSNQRVLVPIDGAPTETEDVQSSTDTVADALAGNYSEGIVDEVH